MPGVEQSHMLKHTAIGRRGREAPLRGTRNGLVLSHLKPMPKSRRKPPRVLFQPRLLVTLGLALLLVLSSTGFVFYTKITLYKQAHFAPESAHPWDVYAALCLFLAMAAAALLLLNKREPPPVHWRRGKLPNRLPDRMRTQTKRRRAGTMKKSRTFTFQYSFKLARLEPLHTPGSPRAGFADAVPAGFGPSARQRGH